MRAAGFEPGTSRVKVDEEVENSPEMLGKSDDLRPRRKVDDVTTREKLHKLVGEFSEAEAARARLIRER